MPRQHLTIYELARLGTLTVSARKAVQKNDLMTLMGVAKYSAVLEIIC